MKKWTAAGKLGPIERSVVFSMISAETRRCANAVREFATSEKGALGDEAFEGAERQLAETIPGGAGRGGAGSVQGSAFSSPLDSAGDGRRQYIFTTW